jgi:flagellar M-ring protein FliF
MAESGKSGAGLANTGGALERVGTMAGNARGHFLAMPSGRRNWMVTSALVMAAMIAGMAWYASRPDWRVLYSGLDSKDTQQVAQELAGAGIAYNMTEDGTGIEVNADEMDKARMEVAAKGMPQSGRMGFELFDKPNWVGSEFDEKVNYQRAMEGELEHTIGTLAAVRSARVHLVLPKESMFGEAEQDAKASVVLQLRRTSMPPEQVEAIRSLVAGAVENLSAQNVTLVDADGRLNLNRAGRGAEAGDAERGLQEKLIAMLEPTAGVGNIRATANVSYDDSNQEKTDEVYDPALVAATSLHKSEQTMGDGKGRAIGVPGTVSNTPGTAAPGSAQSGAAAGKAAPAAAAAAAAAVPPLLQTAKGAAAAAAAAAAAVQKDATLPVYPQAGGGDGQTMTEESGNYAVTRHLTHSEQGPGRIQRVSVAVVVNDRMTTEGTGKLVHTVWTPRSPEEMKRLQELARAAVGYDATRGDQVVIENVGFSSNVPEAAPAGLAKVTDQIDGFLQTQPGLLKTLSFSVLGLLLVMTVLKPMSRQLITTLSQTPALAAGSGSAGSAAGGAAPGGRVFGQDGPSMAKMMAGSRLTDTQEIYTHVSNQIRKEPAQSTRLLETWINAPAEDEE